jgi:GAF domain-containing protein
MTDHSAAEDTDGGDLRFAAELRASIAAASVADTLASPAPPDQLLEMIVRAAARAIPSPEGALMLIDREREVLTFDVVIGSTAATVKDLTVPLGHGIAGLVAASGQALAIANAQEDPRHAREVAEQSGYRPTTILAVPVNAADGTPVGVLELLDRQGQPTFDLADMDLLGLFADQLAVVLDLRRSQSLFAARIGTAIAGIGGLPPDVSLALAGRVESLAGDVARDDAARRTHELAGLVAAIAGRGDAEYEACIGVLRAFAGYIDARPSLDAGLFG